MTSLQEPLPQCPLFFEESLECFTCLACFRSLLPNDPSSYLHGGRAE
jgi:hypothetical protein